MAQERIINRNPYYFGPGPIRRIPTGPFSYFGRQPPVAGFSAAAAVGVAIALIGSMAFKIMFGDPQIKAIEDYYRENPPR